MTLPTLLEDQAIDLEWLDAIHRRWPLATSYLWTNATADWDQRRAVIECMTTPLVTLVLGGTRAGKTTGVRQLDLAYLLGGDHFLTRAWCELNGLDADLIPYGPGVGYMVGQSSGDSIKYHRQAVIDLLGDIPHRAYNANSKGEAWVHIEVAGYSQPATLWFKSVDQGARAHQGISLRFAHVDEESEGEVGRQVQTELYMRVADQNGKVWNTMAPINGMTWVYNDIEVKREHGARVVKLKATDNPTFDKRTLELMYAGMDEDQLAQRRDGEFRSRSGLIYQQWTEVDGGRDGPGHVIEDFDIPKEWPRYRGADFGLSDPTCVLWGAVGDDDTLYIYREHYEAGGTYEGHAKACLDLEESETVSMGWGDPNGPGAIELFTRLGVQLFKARNKIAPGIDAIRNRLRERGDGRPRIKVFRSCTNLRREFRGYVWAITGDVPKPRQSDHAMDACRYLCMGLETQDGFGGA